MKKYVILLDYETRRFSLFPESMGNTWERFVKGDRKLMGFVETEKWSQAVTFLERMRPTITNMPDSILYPDGK